MDEIPVYCLEEFITNCDSSLYYKLRQGVTTNCDRYVITNCDKFYYKSRQVLQIATTVITNCDSTHPTAPFSTLPLPSRINSRLLSLVTMATLHSVSKRNTGNKIESVMVSTCQYQNITDPTTSSNSIT